MLGRKLDRHVTRTFLGPFAAAVAGLAVLLVVFDLFERIDECFRMMGSEGQGFGRAMTVIGTIYAGQVLSFLAGFGGLACLAGAALTVAVLSRNNELTAMQSAGVSLRRAFLPLLVFAFLAGLGQLALTEYAVRPLAPRAEEALDVLYRRTSDRDRNRNLILDRRGRLAVWGRTESGGNEVLLWKGKADLRFWAVEVAGNGRSIQGLSVQINPHQAEPGPDPEAVCPYVTAKRAEWTGEYWLLTEGRFWDFEEGRAHRSCVRLMCDVSPVGLEGRELGMAGLGLEDLFELRNYPDARVELWKRLGLPVLNVILLLVGLPLAVIGGAKGGRLLPLGMALMLGVAYVLLAELGGDVGAGGQTLDFLERFRGQDWLTAMGGSLRAAVDLAAGLPHLVFLVIGGVLYWRMDR